MAQPAPKLSEPPSLEERVARLERRVKGLLKLRRKDVKRLDKLLTWQNRVMSVVGFLGFLIGTAVPFIVRAIWK